VLKYVLPTAAAALLGILVVVPSGYVPLLAVGAAGWLLFWTLRWRAALAALFLFLPVAAVPGLLLQQQGWPTLLKDGLFLLPLYAGFSLAVMRDRSFKWSFPASLSIPLAGLALVVVIEAARLITSDPLVALIGLRSWLLYVPLILVPAVAFSSIAQVQRFIRLLVLVSLIPAVVGLAEFALVASGHSDLAYRWYGDLGFYASQGYAQVGISDQILVQRVPSTFTFVTQFVAYCLVMVPLCLVAWASDPDVRWRRIAALASVMIIAAGFTCGSRTFYLWGPIEISLMLLLNRRIRPALSKTILITGTALALAVGSQLVQIATFISGLGWDYLRTHAAELQMVYGEVGLLGVGAGMGTNGSRYVLASHELPFRIEGWYGLTFLELGLAGLILIAIIWGVLLRRAWTGMRVSRRTTAEDLAVATFVILLCSVVNLIKGLSLEYDPLNVYFWLIAGLALALPQWAIDASAPGREVSEPRNRFIRSNPEVPGLLPTGTP